MQIQRIVKRFWQRQAPVLTIILIGIGSLAAVAGEPLEQRVQRYWEARVANDLHTVYRLESGALPGGGLTPDQYRRLGGLPVREVEVVETKVEGDQAKVKVKGQVGVGSLGWMPQVLTQQWVLIDGEWYHQTANP